MPTPGKNHRKNSSAKSATPPKKTGPKAKPGDKRLGNKFYLQRAKHGRDALFETPELLWQAALEYFALCDKTPFVYEDVSAGRRIATKKQRPYIIEGFCTFCDCSFEWFRKMENTARERGNQGLVDVIARIRGVMYEQKASGAVTGVFNHQIVSKILGIKEAVDLEVNGELKNKVELTEIGRAHV